VIRGEAVIISKGIASYNIADDEDKTLYYDTADEVKLKVQKLAVLVKNAKHTVAFTGAGITVSAGVPDYRSPDGVWEMQAKGLQPPASKSFWDIVPSPAHMSLAKLIREGMLKHVVTTNLDALHLRSGLTLDNCSELHGNGFKKVCLKCKKYSFFLPGMKADNDFWKATQLICPRCNGPLEGTNVGFGSNLPEDEINKARAAVKPCDLALVLGTSMRVSPACNLPEASYKNGGHLVICNLQKTPYDKYAALVIHAKTDDVMTLLMEELKLEIPKPPEEVTWL